jgi:heme-degrading monooxygenase HmoA
MIARTWHGRVMTAKADAYLAHLKRTGLSEFRSTPGNMGVYVLRRDEDGITHFMVTTLWSSMDSVRSAAGENPDRARYYPQDDEFLLEREPLVTHYDVLMAITGPPTS